MPFRKSCRITITNEGRRRISNLYYHVDWEKRNELPPDTGYFHAWYKQELPDARRQTLRSAVRRKAAGTM